jgi:DNA-directed RNA polymerase specialized sigma24 family protein
LQHDREYQEASETMNKQGIRARLENWAQWSRRPIHGKGPGSMTGIVCDRLRRAALGNVWSGVEARTVIDEQDAQLVELAWRSLAPKHREILRWHHIRNAPPGLICRRLHIAMRPESIFKLELARAEQAIDSTLAGERFHKMHQIA